MNFALRPVESKSTAEIAIEWDSLASVRLEQILSGQDLTYKHVLSPLICEMIRSEPSGSILDAGCGIGALSDNIATFARKVVGIDPSRESIIIANRIFGNSAKFYHSTIEEYSRSSKVKFDIILCNMVLMDVMFLDEFLSSVSRLLRRGGLFIFSITHPCFWPEYYGYSDKNWFEYRKETIVESPFRISRQQDCTMISTHVHRPLERYIEAFSKVGLLIESLEEPMPSVDVNKLYPTPWTRPRYIIGRCRIPRKFGMKI